MIFINDRIEYGDTMDTTENIKEIDWSSTNFVLNEIADYYLKSFEIDKKINDKLISEFNNSVNDELCGIKIQEYLKTNNCSLELITKYDKLLRFINDYYNEDNVNMISSKKVPIESYLLQMKEKLKEKDKVVQASINPYQTIEEIENDYSMITELLGDDDIVIKFRDNS